MRGKHSEETKRKIGETARRNWERPWIRARVVQGTRRAMKRREIRERIAAGMRLVWAERRAAKAAEVGHAAQG